MSTLTKRERVEAEPQSKPVDRVPVSAWRHFIPAEREVSSLARASLLHRPRLLLDEPTAGMNPTETTAYCSS